MKSIFRGFIIVGMLVMALPIISHAQIVYSEPSCNDDTSSLPGETTAAKNARLTANLNECAKEQAQTQIVLENAQNQSSSLKRDILILDTNIKAATLNIKAKNLAIASLGKNIVQKEQAITSLLGRIDAGRQSLAQIMRKTNEVGAITIPEIILSQENLTDVFSDLDTFQSVQSSLKTIFEEIRTAKSQTETEKNNLDKRKNAEEDARQAIQKEQKNIAGNQTEKQRLLTISKGNEKAYSMILVEKAQKAAQIRAALFGLAGGGKAIPFGDALAYANEAKQKTFVDPAFLLAILTQESNLGSNVGKCYLSDTTSGSGYNPTTSRIFPNVMKPSRDIPPFLTITEKLGMDPLKTVVSCPIPSAGGYGGAMGPAQFIASTWVLLENRIAAALGVAVPNPWQPRDAFTASAFYLSDLGGSGSSYSAKIRAACRYYGSGGSTCSYGRSVMSFADSIQRNIDLL